jgi:hypothetical protein
MRGKYFRRKQSVKHLQVFMKGKAFSKGHKITIHMKERNNKLDSIKVYSSKDTINRIKIKTTEEVGKMLVLHKSSKGNGQFHGF